MFIYQFMAGIVDTITGDDEEFYDPHKHRKVPKPTSYSETMIHLLKGSVGAGILAMPEAVSRLGLIGSCIGILIVGFFGVYCIQLLIAAQYELCKRARRGYIAYPKAMRAALASGPPALRGTAGFFCFFVDFVLVLWQIGICCIYAIFVSTNMKQVMDHYGVVFPLRLHLCFLLAPLILLNLVKDLKLMTPMSSASNILTMLGLLLVFYYLMEEDVEVDVDMLKVKSLADVPVFIGTALFALEAVGVVLALEYNMEHPERFVGPCGLFNVGMAVIVVLYTVVGICGYLKYGEQIEASITLNLPAHDKKAQAAKVIFAMAIFMSFPLQNFVAYAILWRKLKRRLRPGAERGADYGLRVGLVVLPWSLGVAMPSLGPCISLFGALCLSLLAMVFPGVMDACVWYPAQYGRCRYRLLRDLAIVALGLACCGAGCYTSVLEMTQQDGGQQ